ncbi:MAG: HEAT repeat domain-containing protein [Myxococcales bacterium]|nr:HEAT repeat domain-containing protein [Myxococcales bacterium]
MRNPNLFWLWWAAALTLASGCVTQNSRPPEEARPPAPPPKPQDMKVRVLALISGYERVPTEEEFKELGPGALAVLDELYADASQLPTTRTRAVASMALVDNPEAEKRLQDLVADPKVDVQYRSTAVAALAHRAGEKALSTLAPLLESEEPRMRDAAARALGRIGTAEARKTLEERLGKEQDAAVREAIQQSLTKMEP